MEDKMVEEFKYKGEWFLPTAKDHRLSGILSYSADASITLELFGDFDRTSILNINLINEYDIILGLTNDSKEITLYKCFLKSRDGMRIVSNQEIGTPSTLYYVQYILEGIHIDKPEELKFDRLISEIVNLDEWIETNGFISDVDKEIELHKNKEYQINYKLPNAVEFSLSDNLDGQFSFTANKTFGHPFYQKSITIAQEAQLVLKYKQEQTLENMLGDLYKFRTFLAIALYEQTMPKKILLYNENYRTDYGNDIIINTKVNLFCQWKVCEEKTKMFTDMLFCYKDMMGIFPEIIRNWFDKYKKFESAFNLLAAQFYNDVFTENTFLNLAQAAESFHAHTERNRPQIQKIDYDTMKEDILNVVDEKYHAWLNKQFSIGNYLPLHTRLEEIITFWSCEALDKIIGDKNVFIRQVKNTRNYYTHYSSELKKHALTGIELLNLTQKLKLLLTCAFLIEIGIDKTILDKLLKNRMYKFYYPITKRNSSLTKKSDDVE